MIYHNPRCSKSRKTLELLRAKNIEPEIIEYLNSPPTRSQLTGILRLLDMGPRDLIRTGEAAYRENGIDDPSLTDDQLLDAMIEHPILIQRPIVVVGDRAAIGRPPEIILDLV